MPPLFFCQTWGKKALQMVRTPCLCSRKVLTAAGEFDMMVSGIFMPEALARTSCRDLLLMAREAEQGLMTRIPNASNRYITDQENQRYSPSANLRSGSATFGLGIG